MSGIVSTPTLNDAVISTTQNGAHPIEFWAQRFVDKLIHVGPNVSPEIQAQAEAYKARIHALALSILHQSRASDRAHIGRKLKEYLGDEKGQPLAALIEQI